MSNHIHLAVQVGELPLSRIVHNLSFRYARWFNWRQQRTGHLFQGRHEAILVETESYLLELVRYIHLNPVRAGLVEDPRDYSWSGHRAYLGEQRLSWLTTGWVLGRFAQRVITARKRYRAFVDAGTREGYRGEFHGGEDDSRVLGSDRFVERVAGRSREVDESTISLRHLVRRVCQASRIKEADLMSASRARWLSDVRATVAWLAVTRQVATLAEVGSYLNRDASTLSRAVSKMESTRRRDRKTARRLKALSDAIIQ